MGVDDGLAGQRQQGADFGPSASSLGTGGRSKAVFRVVEHDSSSLLKEAAIVSQTICATKLLTDNLLGEGKQRRRHLLGPPPCWY
jgi:hypothetical protein